MTGLDGIGEYRSRDKGGTRVKIKEKMCRHLLF